MKIDRMHHVAYRCRDAKETVLWSGKMPNMDFVLAIAENEVPSTKAPDPCMHVFLDAGHGNVLAFFERPTRAPMGRDPNTPSWVQHIASKVADREELLEFKAHLEANGVDAPFAGFWRSDRAHAPERPNTHDRPTPEQGLRQPLSLHRHLPTQRR